MGIWLVPSSNLEDKLMTSALFSEEFKAHPSLWFLVWLIGCQQRLLVHHKTLTSPCFFSATAMNHKKQLSTLQLLIYLLPPCNCDTLLRLLELLSKVASHAQDSVGEDGQEVMKALISTLFAQRGKKNTSNSQIPASWLTFLSAVATKSRLTARSSCWCLLSFVWQCISCHAS